MGEWTPGPWTAFYKSKYDEWHVSLPNGGAIKTALCPDGIQSPNREADAHLIAAAPDLAEAVRRQVENIERWRETGIPASPEESKSIYEQLLAALTRATGG